MIVIERDVGEDEVHFAIVWMGGEHLFGIRFGFVPFLGAKES